MTTTAALPDVGNLVSLDTEVPCEGGHCDEVGGEPARYRVVLRCPRCGLPREHRVIGEVCVEYLRTHGDETWKCPTCGHRATTWKFIAHGPTPL